MCTGLGCGDRREQVGIEDEYFTGSVYTITETFKNIFRVFKIWWAFDSLCVNYINQNSLGVQSRSLYRQIVLIAQWSP